jgi:hypothetical protein
MIYPVMAASLHAEAECHKNGRSMYCAKIEKIDIFNGGGWLFIHNMNKGSRQSAPALPSGLQAGKRQITSAC